jgi:hypothetical protein
MSVDLLPELKEVIDSAQHPIVVVVVAEGCDKFKGKFVTDIEERLRSQSVSVHLHTVCYNEDDMVFPRPMTQAVYYFAPRNYAPLFFRQGGRALAVEADLATAQKMIQGMGYTNAAYPDDVSAQYEKTEAMVKHEDMTQFPSAFQQARNFAKEMWHAGKNAAQGLPVLVEADIAFQRFSICQGCEFFKNDSRCEKCGCFMKTKTHLASASCPIEKWHATMPVKQLA